MQALLLAKSLRGRRESLFFFFCRNIVNNCVDNLWSPRGLSWHHDR